MLFLSETVFPYGGLSQPSATMTGEKICRDHFSVNIQLRSELLPALCSRYRAFGLNVPGRSVLMWRCCCRHLGLPGCLATSRAITTPSFSITARREVRLLSLSRQAIFSALFATAAAEMKTDAHPASAVVEEDRPCWLPASGQFLLDTLRRTTV